MNRWQQLKNLFGFKPAPRTFTRQELEAERNSAVMEYIQTAMDKKSPLPSPSDWDLRRATMGPGCPDPIFWQRYCDCLQADEACQLNPYIVDALWLLCGGAVGTKPLQISVTPAYEGTDADNAAIQFQALLARLPFLLCPSVIQPIAFDVGKYGNLPVFLSFKGRELVDLKPFSPHGMVINLDSRMRFNKNQKDCYIQYDVMDWAKQYDQFGYDRMAWAAWQTNSFLPYGNSPISLLHQEIGLLSKARNSVAEARDNLSPMAVIRLGLDSPLDENEMQRTKARLPWFVKEKKDKPPKGAPLLLNGSNGVDVIQPGTGYFNETEDIRQSFTLILNGFKVAYALAMDHRGVDAKVMDILQEMMFGAQANFLSWIEWTLVREIIEKMALRAGLDTKKVKIVITWAQDQTPTRQLQATIQAQTAYDYGLISRQSTQEIFCNYLNRDAQIEEIRINKEKEAGTYMGGKRVAVRQEAEKPEQPMSDDEPGVQGVAISLNPAMQQAHAAATSNGRNGYNGRTN